VELELALLLVVDGDAGDVAGEQVGGELDARAGARDCLAERAGEGGLASSSTWPSLMAVASTSSTTWRLPMMACSMLSASRLKVSANQAACSGAIVMLFPLGGGSCLGA
jgi:hypothetical protein